MIKNLSLDRQIALKILIAAISQLICILLLYKENCKRVWEDEV